ncbi:hypothetical protein EVC62_02320 [Salinicola endophyticus]|uniref:Uncharacterized protein n=1 Tax=Salinicola endophyticus TaxID=1949083 RepID=A0ABY8FCA6_9GAMM|nr:hypothetical protein [Salinicola endophyticus]WFF40427.1 hypothetical protein EVC62_02320 [Salinicola endophyticus]
MKKRTRRHSLDRRRQALARQLIIYGKRQERDAEFAGGLHRPITMSERDAMAAYEWLLDKPLRFWIRATVYCRDDAGDQYRESREAETQQAATANDLAPFRMQMLAEARAAVNARHVVAEGFEMRVI